MSNHSFLENFIQLIQLWATICALFFYQDHILAKSPNNQLSKLQRLIKKFISSHQLVASTDEKAYDPIKWVPFRDRIKNMAAMTFFYCVFLLIYIGVQREWDYFYPIQHPSFLIIINLIVLSYLILCWLCNYQIFHTYFTPGITIIVFLLFFLFYEYTDKHIFDKVCHGILVHKNTWFWVSISTLFVSITGIFMILLRIWRDNIILKRKYNFFLKLDYLLDICEDSINEILKVDSFSNLSTKTRFIISIVSDNDETQAKSLFDDDKAVLINIITKTLKNEYENIFIEEINNGSIIPIEQPKTKQFTTELPIKDSNSANNINTKNKELLKPQGSAKKEKKKKKKKRR